MKEEKTNTKSNYTEFRGVLVSDLEAFNEKDRISSSAGMLQPHFNFQHPYKCSNSPSKKENSSRIGLASAFLGGVASVILVQSLIPSIFTPPSTAPVIHCRCAASSDVNPDFGLDAGLVNAFNDGVPLAVAAFPEDIGSTVTHAWPPPSPTNAIPTMFPTKIGYAGPTATGAEPGLVMTAPTYPMWSGMEGLVQPEPWRYGSAESNSEPDLHSDQGVTSKRPTPSWIMDEDEGKDKSDASTSFVEKPSNFSVIKHWGNLTPFHSVPRDSFGIHSSTGPEVPSGCELKGAHIVHRHGARYPTNWDGFGSAPAFASRLHKAAQANPIKAHGKLSFLNTWNYKLGIEVLTPFGRQQLFDLGVSMRLKYGALLEKFKHRLPVFRTESQDRMLASATNFALGFFGWPLDGKFQLSVTVEHDGYNNTLAPYKICPNADSPEKGHRGNWYIEQWVNVYLVEARSRIQGMLEGYELLMQDVYTMQIMCAYETVALGYSGFCDLFTEEEWEGFEYSMDLYFWYDSGFGSPVSRALGSGYVLELLSRLTQTTISPEAVTKNPSTFSVNTTLAGNPVVFPLDQPLYVDATHEVVIVNILTALNLSVMARDGPPPPTKMKRERAFLTSRIAPFASNMQFQLLSCPSVSHSSGDADTQASAQTDHIRIILNDAVVALTGIEGCPEQKDGLCPVHTFIKSQKRLLEGADWDWTCCGNWTLPEGNSWHTVTGDPPLKPANAEYPNCAKAKAEALESGGRQFWGFE